MQRSIEAILLLKTEHTLTGKEIDVDLDDDRKAIRHDDDAKAESISLAWSWFIIRVGWFL